METTALERTVTELDHVRLRNLIHRAAGDAPTQPATHDIEHILEAAAVVESRGVPSDIVTMYSQVLLSDLRTGRQRKLTLCYPHDAEPSDGFISVFSPVGASLLGLRVGCTARWRTPLGDEGCAEVLAILFQPEASGDYTM
ncbi:Regulator of nucleoside diphosphate kinase [Burkholderiaceae bacterium]|nr:Regulator of nucleoside diphosphate kinase [Burkholderiaceae bacterium]